VKERVVVMMFLGADEESRLVWEAVRSLGRRNYYRGRRFSIPSINHYKIPIQEENVTEGILSLKERTPGCNAKARKPSLATAITTCWRRSTGHWPVFA
jgi:hypothetical protein